MINKIKPITLVLLLILIIPAHGNAASASNLMDGKFDNHSRTQRIEIANDVLNYVKQLKFYIPNQKPSETAWLEAERKSIEMLNDGDASTSRFLQFYESPEFQHQKLSGLLKVMIDALACAADKKIDIKREMLCWSVASFHMSDKETLNDAIRILRDSGRLPKDIVQRAALGESLGFGVKYGWYGRGIQEYIIIPYLAGQIE